MVHSATGRSGFGFDEYTFAGDIPDLTLGAGTYWLMLSIDKTNNPDSVYYVSTTSGTNGVGSPIGNGNSFLTTDNGAFTFTPTGDVLGDGATYDFSYGVSDTILTPEPASFGVLALGALSLLRRRR